MRPAIDALLWVETARALSSDGSVVEARAALARAVECMPGDPALVLQEREFDEGGPLSIDLRSLVLGATRGAGREQGSEAGDGTTAIEGADADPATT
jgi:hypothetical protein